MENLPTNIGDLSSKVLFDAFKLQLAKDFEQSNFQAGFIHNLEPDYRSIHEKIASELQRSEKTSSTKLMQLLYRIDISEGMLKKYLNQNSTENYFNVIAELIIKRVLQKSSDPAAFQEKRRLIKRITNPFKSTKTYR